MLCEYTDIINILVQLTHHTTRHFFGKHEDAGDLVEDQSAQIGEMCRFVRTNCLDKPL